MGNRQILDPFGLVGLLTGSGGVRPLDPVVRSWTNSGAPGAAIPPFTYKLKYASVGSLNLRNDSRNRPSIDSERRKRINNRVEPDFFLNRRRFIRSGRRFAQNRFLRVAVFIFPVSTPDFVEKTPREGFSDPRSVIAQFCRQIGVTVRRDLAR